jgi:hypothetical protein
LVRTLLPRVAPFRSICLIRRAIEQRTTSMPSRCNCRRSFQSP